MEKIKKLFGYILVFGIIAFLFLLTAIEKGFVVAIISLGIALVLAVILVAVLLLAMEE